MDPLFPAIPEDFSALDDTQLDEFITGTADALRGVTADPASHVSDELSAADLLAASRASAEALTAARTEKESRVPAVPEITDEDLATEMAELAAVADESDPGDEQPDDDEPETATATAEIEVEPVEAVEPVVASAKPKPVTRGALPQATRERQAPETVEQRVALTAAAGPDVGTPFPTMEAVAEALQTRRRQFGIIPNGTSGEKVPVVRADWSGLYPDGRRLGGDPIENMALIASALDPEEMKAEQRRRAAESLTASGGLCAPVTPYYQLQMISQAARPVRAALASFNADRGGIRFGRPAALTAIGSAVGVITAAQDAAGGSDGTKSCQVIDCPDFEEVDVAAIFHCLQFGNLGARTFPERVTQWTSLVMAAHARLAESRLLTGIDTASTQVTAGSLGLGATASLLGQILTAAVGMRNRHRMDDNAVLRLLLPSWAIAMLVSDVIRSQFQRFDTDAARIQALLRTFNVEVSYYIDSAAGRGQVYGAQGDGALLPFPDEVVWYLYPEGSFLYLDGGTLELGLVRDSILNATNDMQVFGETFENVAFIGIESLAVASAVCDSGTVSAPADVACPIDYAATS